VGKTTLLYQKLQNVGDVVQPGVMARPRFRSSS